MVEGISVNLKQLNLLSLFGIITITNDSIDSLADSENKQTLETLDVNGCREITKSDESTLKSLFPNLKVLIFHS